MQEFTPAERQNRRRLIARSHGGRVQGGRFLDGVPSPSARSAAGMSLPAGRHGGAMSGPWATCQPVVSSPARAASSTTDSVKAVMP
jgi:hypothetical protein